MINRITALAAVLLASLACASGPSELAQAECAPEDADACETCFFEKCQQQCYDCVDDPVCYGCTEDGISSAECTSNEQTALLLTCALGAMGECKDACKGEGGETRPPPKVGKGRKGRGDGGGGGGAGRERGDKGGGGGGGGRGGKGGKGGKTR